MADTWQPRDLPILEVIAEADRPGRRVSSAEIASRLEMKMLDVRVGLRALVEAKYATGPQINIGEPPGWDYPSVRLLERGRRATLQWPPEDAYAALVAALEARLAATADPQTRSALQKLLAGLRELGKETAGDLLAGLIRDMMLRGGL